MSIALRVALASTLLAGCASINSDDPPPPGPDPSFRPGFDVPFNGTTWRADEAPPPVTGGHLAVLPSGDIAAADPSTRRLFIVSSGTHSLVETHALGGEPGRVVADGDGGVHVVLRDAAAIASVHPITRGLTTRAVCASPRGLGWSAAHDALFVACFDGRVQRLAREGGAVETIATLAAGDLRDVVPQPEGLWVTHFRAARAVLLSYEGEVLREVGIPAISTPREDRIASIAWRAVPHPEGGILIAHQRHTNRTVSTVARPEDPFAQNGGAYGGFDPSTGQCHPPLVTSAVTHVGADGTIRAILDAMAPMPVDLAVDPYSSALYGAPQVMVASAALMADSLAIHGAFEGRAEDAVGFDVRCGAFFGPPSAGPEGQVISLAYAGETQIVQTQFPSRLRIGGHIVFLGPRSSVDGGDVGHALFHAGTSSGLACASCHPEGGEDGVRWSFFGVGSRRTQELRGGLLGTAPFHWSGDRPEMVDIMDDVFRARMGGGSPTEAQMEAVGLWLDRVPLPDLEPAGALAAEGLAVFSRAGCAECHSGAMGTNNDFADFGRGLFQVPPLAGVSFRGPWMHDGCARTLESTVLASCAGPEHSVELPASEVEALVAYLRTL